MSSITQVTSNNNSQVTNYETSKFLLGDNRFIDGTVEASGSDIDLVEAMVMGRVASTGKLVPLSASATDGSQLPVGLCVVSKTIPDGSSATVRLVNKGRVSENKINFIGSETLDTAITITDGSSTDTTYKKTIRDLLNEIGLVLEDIDELTNYDN